MSATPSEHARLDQLAKTPYIQVLTYPKITLRGAKSRVKQLERLHIDELIFEGHAKVGRLGILGLGTVGIVVKARVGQEIRALKIRRTDANRPDMEQEVKITSMANKLGIGPPIYGHTRDLLLMKLLVHQELQGWFKGLRGAGSRAQARDLVHQVLNQCRKLDIMGIDHGQLSNLRKHVVVAEGFPWIIDFESAGRGRRTKNLTTAAQYLFIGGKISSRVRRILGIRSTAKVLEILRDYKREGSDYHYSRLLRELRLAPE